MKKKFAVGLTVLVFLICAVVCAGCKGNPEPVAVLGSILPEQPWNSMTWVRFTPHIGRYESGQYDPETMYSLLEALPLYAAEEEPTEEENADGYLLMVCNPEIQPLTRYTVWIGTEGTVTIENDQPWDTRYYRTDPEIVDALDEMLLGYSLGSAADIGKVKTFADLLPEQPWKMADWIDHDEQAIVGQGQIDPEKLLQLADKIKLVPQDTGLDPEKRSYTLLIANPDAVPTQRCDIYIDELGNVEFGLRVAQGYLTVQYYKADPSLYGALTEIFCPEQS